MVLSEIQNHIHTKLQMGLLLKQWYLCPDRGPNCLQELSAEDKSHHYINPLCMPEAMILTIQHNCAGLPSPSLVAFV